MHEACTDWAMTVNYRFKTAVDACDDALKNTFNHRALVECSFAPQWCFTRVRFSIFRLLIADKLLHCACVALVQLITCCSYASVVLRRHQKKKNDIRGCERSDITKHILIHETPRHACDVCGKSFRHIKNKELHMKRLAMQADHYFTHLFISNSDLLETR